MTRDPHTGPTLRGATPHLCVWRLVLEAASPLSIATGRGDGERDTLLAHDANGLPFIPASSLAGVLRAALPAHRAEDEGVTPEGTQRHWFGFAEGDAGNVSLAVFSHAHIHGANNRPITGLVEPDQLAKDPLLGPLLSRRNAQRQRVRLNHRGSADDAGLFDRSVLPAGHRFSVEWLLWSAEPEPALLRAWATLLMHGYLRLGGLTRAGFGELRVVQAHGRSFDLRQLKDLQAHAALPRDLAQPHKLPALALKPLAGAAHEAHWGTRRVRLSLTPEAGFRVGGGTVSLLGEQGKPNADKPMTEARVLWSGDRGQLQHQPSPLLPGTSIKGALAHRVAFHANRLSGVWASPERAKGWDKALHCDSVRRLFGSAGNDREQDGQAGLITVSDLLLDPSKLQAQTRMHNHIDRFTGGVRDGMLFANEDLFARNRNEPLLEIVLTLDTERAARVNLQAVDLEALELALDDLCNGRMALGADAASGLGFFTGSRHWDGDGQTPIAPHNPAGAQAA
ncbi:MAG: RAMP superfamily CRISPR-associated protein [Burkholderiales bacterium]|jgi:CRISPR/Cas system CMR subunit Cmr4 (Cas7 group RAMP superfamily)